MNRNLLLRLGLCFALALGASFYFGPQAMSAAEASEIAGACPCTGLRPNVSCGDSCGETIDRCRGNDGNKCDDKSTVCSIQCESSGVASQKCT